MSRRLRQSATIGLAAVLAFAQPRAQTAGGQGGGAAPGTTPGVPTYSSVTTAVLVDVVVRDREGRPVTDLTAADFHIREDDVPQTLGSFTRISKGGGIGITVGLKDPNTTTLVGPPSGEPPGGAAAEPDPLPSMTALVFDALSPEAVALCQRAALDYVPLSGSTSTSIGVFATEPTVTALQRYTTDPGLVRQALRRVSSVGSQPREGRIERVAALRQQRDALDQAQGSTLATVAGSGAPVTAATAGTIGQLEFQRRLVQGQLRMIEAFDTLDRDQRGMTTTSSLFAVLQTLVEERGRKTLVFFSEGLPASPALQAHLRAVIDAANRSNVTVYAIDASGLRAVSGTLETRQEVEEAGKQRLRQLATPGDYAEQPLMRVVERTEDLLRFDGHGGLARLAEETGGFLVRDTNDLRQAFRRIDEDMRFHYLLTYAPANQRFDGRFRSIAVKVARPGVEVFARKGYRALRFSPAVPVLDFEAPALAALDSSRLPNAFPFSTAIFSFPESGRSGLSPLLVRLKTEVLTFHEDVAAGTYDAEATIVVRFRDESGRVVQKASQQYQLSGRLHELPSAKRGEIIFFRDPELAAGLYTVETAIVDKVGTRASTRVATLEVPRVSSGGMRLSSVVLVGRIERVESAARDAANPLYVGDLLLYPAGGEPLTREGHKELVFFYTVYPRPGAAGLPAAELELQRNGRVLARTPLALGVPDATGRIQQVSRLPLAPLAPGTYQLRVIVRDEGAVLERSAYFKVAS